MSNFISNSGENNLKNRLIELIIKSQELKFLVGFFYFSGIRELYESLQDNNTVKIKVLVGLNVDKINLGLVEYAEKETDLSDDERTYKFFESIKKSINSDDFDSKDFREQVKFFINLIIEDRLIIRKTYSPNHAKIYIFKLNEEQVGRKNLFVTGSSNLTKAGLTTQEEFNVEISDYGVDEANNYFDQLWDEAVKITEDDLTKQKLITIIKKDTLIKDISPFEAYVLVLKTYLDSFKKQKISPSLIELMKKNKYEPYCYQIDAVKQALSVIQDNNGVIIADVVGLGKSIIASAVAREIKKRGIIICPPGIMGDKSKKSGWKKYAEEFELHDWEVWSLGDLENAYEFVQKAGNIEAVIVDEAHRFRNEDTRDYELLKNICRNRITILLTATPFNNTPNDILSLLELFITPKKSVITLENNLKLKFKIYNGRFDRLAFIKKNYNSADNAKRQRAENYYQSIFEETAIDLGKINKKADWLAKQIRDTIEPVTIRRNRLDLQNNPVYKEEVKNLSKIANPQEWFYELTAEQSKFYDQILTEYFSLPEEGGRFTGAIYRPFEYEVENKKIKEDKLTEKENFQFQQQRNLYDFMRRLLVKRFESSFGAFAQSIKNFININKIVLTFAVKTDKYILDRNLLEKIYNWEMDEIEQALNDYAHKLTKGNYPKNYKVYDLNEFKYKRQFISNIESDIELFKKIFNELEKLDLINNDPKVDCLIKKVREILQKTPENNEPIRKVAIFSEYVDTVKHLQPILKREFIDKVYTVAGKLSGSVVKEINENFDASYENPNNDYDILLASDRISEGFNLNRAGIVINYDIPWNPVRVIQRVGRINRISKKVFAKLYITNFFPTEKGANFVRSREIASHKMFLIHNTLGEDSKIFDIDETPTPAGLYERVQQNPDEFEEESFYTKIYRSYLEIIKSHPDLAAEIKNYPARIKVAKKFDAYSMLLFIKKNRLYVRECLAGDGGKPQINSTTLEEILFKVECAEDEPAQDMEKFNWDFYQAAKEHKEEINIPTSENSLEQRALNNIASIINQPWEPIMPYLDFLRAVREDIMDYGTLPDYTLRRFVNLKFSNEPDKGKTAKEIKEIRKILGDDYLEKEKEKNKNLTQEIIIAIENREN